MKGSIGLISFKDGFKRARKATGLSQEKFADKYGFSLPAVKKWEQGKAVPESEKLCELCEIFQCDMSYLFYQIELPTHNLQFIKDQTGLTENAIQKLMKISNNNKITWWMDTLNELIESEYLVDFLCSATDYIDDTGETVELLTKNVTAFTRKAKMLDVTSYTCQVLLSKMLDGVRSTRQERFDSRPFYSYIRGLLDDGRMDIGTYTEIERQLDLGDYSSFNGGNHNG